MKIKSVFFTSVVAIFMIVFVFYELSASSPNILIPFLISDTQAINDGEIVYIDNKSTQTAVHVAWTESIYPSNKNDTDVFYRRLPDGATTNLSKSVSTLGAAGPIFIQPSTGDDVCVLWREETASGDYFLFLWRSVTNSTTTSPNPVGSGSADDLEFISFECPATAEAKIAWVDSPTEVYFWDESSDTQIQLSNEESGFIHYFQRVDTDNNIYLIWDEPVGFSSPTFMWDEASNTVQQIFTVADDLQLMKDKTDTVYLFWEHNDFNPFPCFYYWNNQTEVIDLIMECSDWEFKVVQDGEENIHAAWSHDYQEKPIYYWNVTEDITETIELPHRYITNMNLLGGPDDTAHLLWQDDSTDSLYYWNSNVLSVTMVTESTADVQDSLKWAFDSTGTFYMVWADSLSAPSSLDINYWTPSLAVPIELSQSALSNPQFDVAVDSQDVVHVVFSGQPDRDLNYWRSDENEVNGVAQDIYNSYPLNLMVDVNDDSFVFYRSYPDATSIYYWSEQSGESYLGKGSQPYPVLDQSGNPYAYWVGGWNYPQGNNVYAAWNFVGKYKVYLPTIVK